MYKQLFGKDMHVKARVPMLTAALLDCISEELLLVLLAVQVVLVVYQSLCRNIAILSQKFPKIEFKELTSLLEDVSSKYEGCCEGDAVKCIRRRVNILSNQVRIVICDSRFLF